MKRIASYWIVFLLVFGCLGVFSAAAITSAARNDPAGMLLGEWIVADKFGKGDGEAIFKADMTYALKEIHPDGTTVTHEGQYRLDTGTNPCGIDLCVGKFSNAGSEWVTTFGILRFNSDNKAEIHFDPSGKRPGGFDGATDKNTHRLTRKPGSS